MAIEDRTNPMQGVSGPGSFAKRTDLSYQSPEYGAGVEMAAQKAGAPLAKSGGVKLSQAPTVPAGGAPAGVGLFDPTQRPDEHIMHGNQRGPGPGPESLMMTQPADDSAFRMSIQAAKPVLAYIADLPNTSPETRAALKELWDM